MGWTKKILGGLWCFIKHDKTPLGVTLLLTFGAAGGTYMLTPSINRAIQKDNTRSQHITKTIEQINNDMIHLAESLRGYNYCDSKRVCLQKREAALDKVSAMQWRLIDVAVIERQRAERDHLKEFRNSLTSIQLSLTDQKKLTPVSPALISRASEAGYIVLQDLYRFAGIEESEIKVGSPAVKG